MRKLIIGILAVMVVSTVAVLALNFTGREFYKNNTDLSTSYEKSGVYVELDSEIPDYSTNIETIPYKIVNTTCQPVDVVLIPKLERNLGLQFEDKWEQVDFSAEVGFCGTADRIESEWNGEIQMSWFGNLGVGKYRLTFGSYDGIIIEPAEFVLSEGKTTE